MSGLYVPHLKALVVRPALSVLGAQYSSEAAVNLVTGTALAESQGIYLRQLGGGPARSLWQMELATAQDTWNRWLSADAQANLKTRIMGCLPASFDLEQQLVNDMRFGAIMCRLRYIPAVPALPSAGDAAGLSNYHMQFYNRGGAANAAANLTWFRQAIAA